MSIVYVNPYDEKCEEIIKENLELFFDVKDDEIDDLYNKELLKLINYLQQLNDNINLNILDELKEYIISQYKLYLIKILRDRYDYSYTRSNDYIEFNKRINNLNKEFIHINDNYDNYYEEFDIYLEEIMEISKYYSLNCYLLTYFSIQNNINLEKNKKHNKKLETKLLKFIENTDNELLEQKKKNLNLLQHSVELLKLKKNNEDINKRLLKLKKNNKDINKRLLKLKRNNKQLLNFKNNIDNQLLKLNKNNKKLETKLFIYTYIIILYLIISQFYHYFFQKTI